MSQYDWLVEAFPKTVFTVFDTETTGLEPRQNRVVEIGAIRFDAQGIIARFNVLIHPGIPMPAEVTRINGITDAMLKGQPTAEQVLPDFLRFIGDSPLIAHNAPFDVSFINEELARAGKKPLANRSIDTRILAKDVFPGLPKYALQELAVRFGIEAIDAHRAEDDARVCMELFLTCLREMRGGDVATGNAAALPIKLTAPTPQAVTPAESEIEDDYEEMDDTEDDLLGDEGM